MLLHRCALLCNLRRALPQESCRLLRSTLQGVVEQEMEVRGSRPEVRVQAPVQVQVQVPCLRESRFLQWAGSAARICVPCVSGAWGRWLEERIAPAPRASYRYALPYTGHCSAQFFLLGALRSYLPRFWCLITLNLQAVRGIIDSHATRAKVQCLDAWLRLHEGFLKDRTMSDP